MLISPNTVIDELTTQCTKLVHERNILLFKKSIDELIDFHQFILGTYRDLDGKIILDHYPLISPYRKIFDVVLEHADNEDFAKKAGTIILKLLSIKKHENPLADLPRLLSIYDLQMATFATAQNDQFNITKLQNIGLSWLGNWEDVLSYSSYIFGWEKLASSDPTIAWNQLALSGEFLRRHLEVSARAVAYLATAKNEGIAQDSISYFLGWYERISFSLRPNFYFYKPHTINLFSLNSDWNTVSMQHRNATVGQDIPSPVDIFALGVKNYFKDLVLLTGSILLMWFIAEPETRKLTGKSAISILLKPPNLRGINPTKLSFNDAFHALIRIILHDQDHENFIRQLGYIVEERVAHGRPYTPTTLSQTSELYLTLGIGLCLLYKEQADDPSPIFEPSSQYSDIALIRLEGALLNITRILREEGQRALNILQEELQINNSPQNLDAVANKLESVARTINQSRENQIRQSVVNSEKLTMVAQETSRNLLQSNILKNVFPNAEVRIVTGSENTLQVINRFSVRKGSFVLPQMDFPEPSLSEVIPAHLASYVLGRIFGKQLEKTDQKIQLSGLRDLRDWLLKKENECRNKSGFILLAGGWLGYKDRDEFILEGDDKSLLTRKSNMPVGYWASLGKTDIYNYKASLLDGRAACFFCADDLDEILYSNQNTSGVIEISLEDTSDPWQAILKAKIDFKPIWSEENTPKILIISEDMDINVA